MQNQLHGPLSQWGRNQAQELCDKALGLAQAQQNEELCELLYDLQHVLNGKSFDQRFGEGIDRIAAAIAGLPPADRAELLHGEIFHHIADDQDTGGYHTTASVLTEIFTELPDEARTEATAKLLVGLFNTADNYPEIIHSIARQLPEGTLTEDEIQFIAEGYRERSRRDIRTGHDLPF